MFNRYQNFYKSALFFVKNALQIPAYTEIHLCTKKFPWICVSSLLSFKPKTSPYNITPYKTLTRKFIEIIDKWCKFPISLINYYRSKLTHLYIPLFSCLCTSIASLKFHSPQTPRHHFNVDIYLTDVFRTNTTRSWLLTILPFHARFD